MRKIVLVMAVILVIASAWMILDTRMDRYELIACGDGRAYWIDHWTGWTRFMVGGSSSRVESTDHVLDAEEAIRLAKGAQTLLPPETNEAVIAAFLKVKKGPLEITGWKSLPECFSPNDTFLVSFTYDAGGGLNGWFFEVNTEVPLVRYVGSPASSYDAALARHYGLGVSD